MVGIRKKPLRQSKYCHVAKAQAKGLVQHPFQPTLMRRLPDSPAATFTVFVSDECLPRGAFELVILFRNRVLWGART